MASFSWLGVYSTQILLTTHHRLPRLSYLGAGVLPGLVQDALGRVDLELDLAQHEAGGAPGDPSLEVQVVQVVHDQLAARHEGRPVEVARHFQLRRCGGSHGLREIGPLGWLE